ncbi:hypothetical protein [Sphingomonas sp. Leaf62]|uniref:hypothetical protein n=1 Tax=Sphingomonas sp. Leaf62 TaxID=1736228 RepID=UPI0006FDE89E|nr:hypothetical protein [Sphingomonas sp. Leaf62]KQN81934.1 hypothetical protein ASE91_00395 [Sphingomonas sp. Leaf62]
MPILLVTGDRDRDLAPGLVTDWHDHLLPVQSAPAGDKYGVVYFRGRSYNQYRFSACLQPVGRQGSCPAEDGI